MVPHDPLSSHHILHGYNNVKRDWAFKLQNDGLVAVTDYVKPMTLYVYEILNRYLY